MRKIICLVLILSFVLALGACRPNNTGDQAQATPTPTPAATPTPAQEEIVIPTPDPTTPEPGQGKLKDGTYDATGETWKYGNENATIDIKDDKITKITLRRLTNENQEVNYEEWTGVEFEGKVRPNLKEFREEMAKRMIDKQTYSVDAIAGATISCDNWMLAVSRALQQAAK